MEINAEKTKLMTNNADDINTDTRVCGEKLETVSSVKYLGSLSQLKDEDQKLSPELAQTTVLITKLRPFWNDRNITFSSKIRLMRSLVISICELWTLTAELGRRIQITQMKCCRRLLGILYKDSITNVEVWNQIAKAVSLMKIF